MKPAERVAALTAIRAGIDAAITEAKAEALALAESVGVDRFVTPWGRVTVAKTAPKVELDPAPFLSWVREHYPSEVETVVRVRPAFAKAFTERCVIVAGEVVDRETGEVVPFASITAEGDPYITYPASAEQRDLKATATAWVMGRADELAAGVAAIESSEEPAA